MTKKRNIYATLEVFVQKDGKYLMLHRSSDKKIMPGVWLAPGGKREHGEGLFTAARREVMEETGLAIKNIRIRATGVAVLQDLNCEIFFHMLKADYAEGKLIENCPDGKLEWFTKEEIKKLPNLLYEIEPVLDHLLGDNPQVISYWCVYDKGNNMIEFKIENS